MKHFACMMIAFLLVTIPVSAQTDEALSSVNEGTLIGIGRYDLKDTYLSPGKDDLIYSGWGLNVVNERMKMVKLKNYPVSRHQVFNVEVASTTNPASTATNFAGLVDYSLGYHYRFSPLPELKILTGAAFHALGGFIYNTRNGNNPASAKVDIDLNISAMAIYGLKIKDYPVTLRYQMQIPFSGVMFAPHYGQSYYEIFNLGNSSGVIQYNSFHNKFAMKNYITADFPVANFTIRAAYLNSLYYTDVNGIESHIISNSFMIGLVKEFISFGGKRLKKNTEKYRSAYY